MQPDQLILLVQQKNHQAFSKIYEMYSQSIYGVIYNRVQDTEIAEEILQDVFIKVWEKAHTYSFEKGRFYTWILNISRNATIDLLRSKSYKNSKKNYEHDNFVNVLEKQSHFNINTDVIGIKKFIKLLEPMCIKIIELLYFKGFTQKEASDELQIPLGTIKTRNRNCLISLRESMGE